MRDLFVYRPLEDPPSRARAEYEALDPSLVSAWVKGQSARYAISLVLSALAAALRERNQS